MARRCANIYRTMYIQALHMQHTALTPCLSTSRSYKHRCCSMQTTIQEAVFAVRLQHDTPLYYNDKWPPPPGALHHR